MLAALLRAACLLSMALWLGGFTFYGAWVVGIVHEVLDSLTTGTITREVTAVLNRIGLVTLALWWYPVFLRDRSAASRSRFLRVALWLTAATLLGVLILLHAEMAARLDAGRLRGFYAWHRAYLILSTAQWAAGVALLLVESLPTRQANGRAQSDSPP